MPIHRSKFPKGSLEGKCKRGRISAAGEISFQVRFGENNFMTFKKKDSSYYLKPFNGGNVLGIYSKKKEGEIIEVYTLAGDLIYRAKGD